MGTYVLMGEALLLGLASGPACVASCGPVLVPSLLAEREGVRFNLRFLSSFLGARLFAYLLFAVVAWRIGSLASLAPARSAAVFGVVQLLLACVLLWYAYSAGRQCETKCATHELVTIGSTGNGVARNAIALGFLTGVSLCPPFVAAGIRAGQLSNVAAAMFFFAAFFVGTSIWFVPFVGLGCLRRNEGLLTVARMAMALIAFYYGFTGLTMLMGRTLHG